MVVGKSFSIIARKRTLDGHIPATSRDSPFREDTPYADPMAANRCAGDEKSKILSASPFKYLIH